MSRLTLVKILQAYIICFPNLYKFGIQIHLHIYNSEFINFDNFYKSDRKITLPICIKFPGNFSRTLLTLISLLRIPFYWRNSLQKIIVSLISRNSKYGWMTIELRDHILFVSTVRSDSLMHVSVQIRKF